MFKRLKKQKNENKKTTCLRNDNEKKRKNP